MYDKVALHSTQLIKIYGEPLKAKRQEHCVVLKRPRVFQEFLGLSEDDGKIQRGEKWDIVFNFPEWLPLRTPMKSWFEVAEEAGRSPLLAGLLGSSIEPKGMLPGLLRSKKSWRETTMEFTLKDEPEHMLMNYVLFISMQPNRKRFMQEVHQMFGGFCDRGFNGIVEDGRGNHILVSLEKDEPMMVLVPVWLLVGGKEYVAKTWNTVLRGR